MISELYTPRLLRLAAEATGAGRLAVADGSAEVVNPACGDRITVDVAIAWGRIGAIGYQVQACVLMQASASLLARHAPDLTPREIETAADAIEAMLGPAGKAVTGRFADYAMFEPVRAHRSRHDCVMSPLRALLQALAAGAPTGPGYGAPRRRAGSGDRGAPSGGGSGHQGRRTW